MDTRCPRGPRVAEPFRDQSHCDAEDRVRSKHQADKPRRHVNAELEQTTDVRSYLPASFILVFTAETGFEREHN